MRFYDDVRFRYFFLSPIGNAQMKQILAVSSETSMPAS